MPDPQVACQPNRLRLRPRIQRNPDDECVCTVVASAGRGSNAIVVAIIDEAGFLWSFALELDVLRRRIPGSGEKYVLNVLSILPFNVSMYALLYSSPLPD
jgi:hypothetical protein